MNYRNLFQAGDRVTVGLIGTGAFGKSFLFQARAVPKLAVPVVCDRDVAIARQACLRAGMAEAQLAVCGTQKEAQAAVEAGKTAIVEDAQLMMALPVDIVVESTGMPEAGAVHGKMALEHGKHVVMVNKETDSVVGPILGRLAAERGLVYSPADGDQPSLLIGLIGWAETLGLEVVCGGKASVPDFVYDVDENSIKRGRKTVRLPGQSPWALWNMAPGKTRETIEQRSQALHEIPQRLTPDLCEMAVVINATGYGYDRPDFRVPIARIIEMPEIFSSYEAGGILESEGVIDVVHCLRRNDEAGLAGGVFIVIRCEDQATWRLLQGKGHIMNRAGTHALLFRPYHLLGIETATTIFSAVINKLSTGGIDVRPRVDLCAKTTKPLKAGQPLGMIEDHAIPDVTPLLTPAKAIAPDTPVPFYMAAGNRLKVDVPAETVLTYGMIEHQPDWPLWALKRLQDEAFLTNKA